MYRQGDSAAVAVARTLPILSIASLLLAGCTGGGPEATPSQTLGVVTDPGDYSYLQNATPGSHIHDYWQGRSVVTVLDEDGGPMSASCDGCDDGMQIHEGRPEEGSIVPQGTAWLNVTVTWSPGGSGTNDFAGMDFMVKTAQDSELRRVGPVANGVLLRINTTNQQDDPPHYVLSLWRFGLSVQPRPGSDQVAFSGDLHIRVDAVRGLPLVPYPPHPDRWAGATELDLAQDTMTTTEYQTVDPQSGGTGSHCYGGCLGTILPLNGSVVPVETKEVLVIVEVEADGIPAGLGLQYHGADTWTMRTANGTASTPPGTLTFRIPVSGLMADSPYAPQSLWEFELFIDQPGYVRAWTGTYTFTATAVKG